ncbi:hypothetical protein LTR66_004779 [Elasticomyces elasticus]|nr:hypothetical protein LTR66_004779 [Elasticomyces elasticus]
MPINPFRYRDKPKIRRLDHLRVCLVTRGTNVETVLNTIADWDRLGQVDDRITFHIVVDSGSDISWHENAPACAKFHIVPTDWHPPLARYKARALEYFRLDIALSNDDWVLHLDEETQVDHFGLRTCLDFIEAGTLHIGSGTIFYNSSAHWTNPFLATAELTRVTADFGMFRLPMGLFQRPTVGWLHGSWILINGAVENAVTWNTACLAEDFWFGQQAGVANNNS